MGRPVYLLHNMEIFLALLCNENKINLLGPSPFGLINNTRYFSKWLVKDNQ